MGTTTLDARIRLAEHRLAADAGVLVEEFPVPLRGARGSVRVLATGEGQPYLLLHGAALSAAWWIPLMPHLAGRVAAVDLPGHGLSDAPAPRPGTLRSVAVGLVTAVLDIERLEQAVLVGHSLGGAAALWTALDAPGRVSRIVLISDAGPALPGYRPGLVPGLLPAVQETPDRYAAALAECLHEPALLRTRDLAEVTFRCGRRQAGDAGVPPPLHEVPRHRGSRSDLLVGADDLARIDVPVRCLRGRDDVAQPIGPVRDALAGMPRAALHLVAGGHTPWLEAPALIGALIGAAPAGPPQPLSRTI
jgi:pimeloyl-ACP methyl ester carboxylesterase